MTPNYKGTILGLQPTNSDGVKTVYQKGDGRCNFWNTGILAEVGDRNCNLQFVWEGQRFDISLVHQSKGYYKGNIFLDGEYDEDYGVVTVELLLGDNQIMFKGEYNEFYNGLFSCFVELRPIDKPR